LQNFYIKSYFAKENSVFKEQAKKNAIKFTSEYKLIGNVPVHKKKGTLPPREILEFWYAIGYKFDYDRSLHLLSKKVQKTISLIANNNTETLYKQ